jgi:hypothetical protein
MIDYQKLIRNNNNNNVHLDFDEYAHLLRMISNLDQEYLKLHLLVKMLHHHQPWLMQLNEQIVRLMDVLEKVL